MQTITTFQRGVNPSQQSGGPGIHPCPDRQLKIFFSGALRKNWMSGWQRCETLKELGHSVVEFHQDNYLDGAGNSKIRRLITNRVYDNRVVGEFNHDFLSAVRAIRPRVAWLEWPVLLRGDTLREARAQLPDCRWIAFQDDNPFGSRSGERQRWELFLDAAPEYDLLLVKRPSDVESFGRLGAKQTALFMHGCFQHLFYPFQPDVLPSEFRQEVAFVGTPLDHRAAFIAKLLARGIPLRVHGGRWNRTFIYHRRKGCFRPPAVGEDYVRVICGAKINLGFVSSSNHDEYSMRTFEIPACKGFLLAERTPAHQELFEEGKEAEFFDSVEECADKIRFYLGHEAERMRIAEAGYRRCIDSDYSLRRRLREALQKIESLEV